LVSAASPELRFETEQASVAPESVIAVKVLLNAPSAVNAFDLEISYPTNLLDFISADTASSVISLWRSIPWVLGNVVKIEGGAPGGWSGSNGLVAVLNFKALKAGEVEFVFQKSDLYYADGKGTKAEVSVLPLRLKVAESAPPIKRQQADSNPPVIAGAEISENPFGNFNLVFFDVKESESGLQKLEARSIGWFKWSKWSPVPNPVGVERGIWAVEMRATDNQGNVAVRTFYIWKTFFRKFVYFVILPLLFLIGFYFGVKFLRRRRVAIIK
jgi:hypothetical protein